MRQRIAIALVALREEETRERGRSEISSGEWKHHNAASDFEVERVEFG